MDYKIGKIVNYNQKTGVGHIISLYGTYLFTVEDLYDADIQEGDIVRFKGEKVYKTEDKAFFIKKLIVDDKKINQ